MIYNIIAPPISLQSYVHYFWTLTINNQIGKDNPIRTFVDNSSGIILEFDPHQNEGPPRRSMIYGQHTYPTENRDNAPFLAVGVVFHPLAINQLFGIHAYELTNQKVEVNQFLNDKLTDKISMEHGITKPIEVLTAFLAHKINSIKHEHTLLKDCLQYIRSQKGILSVRDIGRHYSLSEKQLERIFQVAIGVSPRHFLKVTRFNHALQRLKEVQDGKLSDLAYDLQYFDQSHFIASVKQLSGLSPKSLQGKLHTQVANLIL